MMKRSLFNWSIGIEFRGIGIAYNIYRLIIPYTYQIFIPIYTKTYTKIYTNTKTSKH